MIAITFALPAESSGFMRKLKSKRTVVAENAKVFYGTISSREVAIFHTGVGRARCQQNIEKFLRAVKPEFLISSGFAGSLTDNLQVGDVIVGANVSDANLTARLLEGGAPATPQPSNWLERGSRELAPPRFSGLTFPAVTLLTVPSMVDSLDERTRLAQQHSADAIDMETDVIAKSCAAHGIRMLSLRVISDSAEAPFPAPPQVLFDIEDQQTKFSKLLPYLAKNPSAVGRLIRFSGQVAKARNALAVAIPEILQML
jgi:adenosylhomocysteine nucleosidase